MAQNKMVATVAVHGAGGETINAPVSFVGNAVDNKTGTIELRATFPNANLALVPGALVDTSVTLNEIDNATVVPHDAVNLGPNSSYVFTISPQMKANIVNVTTLYDDGRQAGGSGQYQARRQGCDGRPDQRLVQGTRGRDPQEDFGRRQQRTAGSRGRAMNISKPFIEESLS